MTRALITLSILLLLIAAPIGAEDLAESVPESVYHARVSIIIDDLGYSIEQGHSLVAVPFDLTMAIIPFTPHSTDIANLAYRFDKEIMIHAPMETLNRKKWEQGLDSSMSQQEVTLTIDAMLDNIPNAKGLNNHGGSKLTQDKHRMAWLMSRLAERKLYFIDSRTTAATTAITAASASEVAHNSRDVFLDNNKDYQSIRKQMEKLRALALEKGSAIGIGHPYPETIRVLAQELPTFAAHGIKIVSASKLATISDKITIKTLSDEFLAGSE